MGDLPDVLPSISLCHPLEGTLNRGLLLTSNSKYHPVIGHVKIFRESEGNRNRNLSTKATSVWEKIVQKFPVNHGFSDKGGTIIPSGTCPPLIVIQNSV